MTIGQYSILSFGDYGKFYSNNLNGNVTLNGIIAIASINASVDTTNINFFPGTVEETVGRETVTVDKDSYGTIDMSNIQEYSANVDLSQPLNLCGDSENYIPATFICGNSQSLPNIKLPFNCKFGTVLNLSNASSVYYTILNLYNIHTDNSNVIRKKFIGTYGDYANNSLGITLQVDTRKINITNEYVGNMSLSDFFTNTNYTSYNNSDYKLYTDDLNSAMDRVAQNATRTYNFGFIGSTPIKISGNGTAKFMGDNSGYEVAPTISVSEVEFGASDLLFQFTKTYGHGTFSAGNYTNTIPSGKTITFTCGFTLGAGHTLIVKGTLIG